MMEAAVAAEGGRCEGRTAARRHLFEMFRDAVAGDPDRGATQGADHPVDDGRTGSP